MCTFFSFMAMIEMRIRNTRYQRNEEWDVENNVLNWSLFEFKEFNGMFFSRSLFLSLSDTQYITDRVKKETNDECQ